MAYDELLADRMRRVLKEKRVVCEERKMMGGLCFMVDDKMCVGIIKNALMARINPEIYEESLNRTACHEMDFTGRPMNGYVMIEPEGIDLDEELAEWIQLALDFNPLAKSSKRKKRAY